MKVSLWQDLHARILRLAGIVQRLANALDDDDRQEWEAYEALRILVGPDNPFNDYPLCLTVGLLLGGGYYDPITHLLKDFQKAKALWEELKAALSNPPEMTYKYAPFELVGKWNQAITQLILSSSKNLEAEAKLAERRTREAV